MQETPPLPSRTRFRTLRGMLWAVSLENGERLAEHKLRGIPVFDGMAAAKGRRFLSLKNGHVACFGEK